MATLTVHALLGAAAGFAIVIFASGFDHVVATKNIAPSLAAAVDGSPMIDHALRARERVQELGKRGRLRRLGNSENCQCDN